MAPCGFALAVVVVVLLHVARATEVGLTSELGDMDKLHIDGKLFAKAPPTRLAPGTSVVVSGGFFHGLFNGAKDSFQIGRMLGSGNYGTVYELLGANQAGYKKGVIKQTEPGKWSIFGRANPLANEDSMAAEFPGGHANLAVMQSSFVSKVKTPFGPSEKYRFQGECLRSWDPRSNGVTSVRRRVYVGTPNRRLARTNTIIVSWFVHRPLVAVARRLLAIKIQ